MKFFELFACKKTKKQHAKPIQQQKEEPNTTVQETTRPIPMVTATLNSSITRPGHKLSFVSNGANTSMRKKSISLAGESMIDQSESCIKEDSQNSKLEHFAILGPKSPEFLNLISEIKGLPLKDRLKVERYIIEKLANADIHSKCMINCEWIAKYADYLCESITTLPGAIFQPELNEGFLTSQTAYSVNVCVWNFLSMLYDGGKQNIYTDGENMKRTLRALSDKEPSLDAKLEVTPWLIQKIQNANFLTERRGMEKAFIDKNANKKSTINYIINRSWWKNYNKYLSGAPLETEIIDNSTAQDSLVRRSFHLEYTSVNEYVWLFIASLYKTEIEIPLESMNNDEIHHALIDFHDYINQRLMSILETDITSDSELLAKLSKDFLALTEVNPEDFVKEEKKEKMMEVHSISEIQIIQEQEIEESVVSDSVLDEL